MSRRLIAHVLLAATLFLANAGYAQQQDASRSPGGDHCVAELELAISSTIAAQKYKEALEDTEELERVAKARFGDDSRCHATALAQRAVVLQLLERSAEAAPLFEQAIGLFRKHVPPDDPELSLTLNNLGYNRFYMHQYDEAARIFEEALELRRKRNPVDEIAVAESLHNLADAYLHLGRPAEDVLKLYQEALQIKMRLLPPNDVSIALTRQNLAGAQEQLKEKDLSGASRNLEQALAIYRHSLPPNDSHIAAVNSRLGLVHLMQGDDHAAEINFREALRLEQVSATTQKTTLAATLDDFAFNQMRMGHLKEAQLLGRQALEIRQAIFPQTHPTIARTLSNLSQVAWLSRDYDGALRLAREASDITIANGRLNDGGRLWLQRHLRAAWSEATRAGQTPTLALTDEAFRIAQRATMSDTAATVLRTALRFSADNAALRGLLKEVDDIDGELVGLEARLTHSLTLVEDQSTDVFGNIREQMTTSEGRRKDLLQKIKSFFPDYARLIDPEPLSSRNVQSLLEPDEALVMVAVGYEEIHLWCITREEVIWRELDLRPQELGSIVATLRSSLAIDPEDKPDGAIKPSLFDLGLAHELYKKLLGAVSSAIKPKTKLLVVPSGPLTSLPLHLLVQSKPTIPKPAQQAAAFRDADWLVKHFAISVLPSVESLQALRERAKPTAGRKALIGFANPLPSTTFVAPGAQQTVASTRGYIRRRSVQRELPASIWSKGAPNIDALRSFLAKNLLGNTEKELKEVGRILGADSHDLFTGARATVTAVKQANLASYRVVYFATHGYLAGAFDQTEPSLALTVPEQPNDFDDGLLTASEVAQLTLDADWVILSACDTAAGAREGDEGLSGLARAFFHAGARALLVSQWALDDKSALEMMTEMFGSLSARVQLSRSEAFRQAMLSQIRRAGSADRLWDAYPARWAVFEMVGID